LMGGFAKVSFLHHKLHGSQFGNNNLLVLFEHQCCVHCLNTNVICLFILFRHKCCMFIRVIYIEKLCM
jgi:hypothetical protein